VSPVTALTVAYDGAAFHGFARQPGLATVQGRLEDALGVALRRPSLVVGAGRTDAGVHALGQVVSFEAAPADPGRAELLRSMNALAGPEIVVTGVRSAREGFSARYDALVREYRYLIVPGPVPPLGIRTRAWWAKGTLDLSAMREAATHLVGEHDFRSFCVTGSAEGQRTVRDIETIDIHPACEMGEHCIVVRVVGRSFLHSMVRIIAGTLVQVGKGRRDPAWVGEALSACERDAAGPTAPPHGLTLWHVTYGDDCWL
jgi:tRNA pseudouridine38-40 synthase